LHTGPEIDLTLPALLPEDYIPDVHLRLRLYKRIASVADAEALSDLRAEMVDRFGPLPPAAESLFRITALKLRAAPLGITRLEVGPAAGLVQFAEDHKVDPAEVISLVQGQPDRYRLEGSHRLRFRKESEDEAARFRTAERLVERFSRAPARP
jgi:transcription-repair coupling factor (superfamily II helicase)